MKAYIISIAVSTVISAVVTMITPEKWSKYVGIVTGLVVTVCIAQPIINLMHADVFEGFSYNVTANKSEGESVLYRQIKTELEKAGSDTSLVADIRSAYYNEKSITKASLISKYSR
jgi:hypothetical protein